MLNKVLNKMESGDALCGHFGFIDDRRVVFNKLCYDIGELA